MSFELSLLHVTARTFKSARRPHVPDFACSPNVDRTTNATTSVTGQLLIIHYSVSRKQFTPHPRPPNDSTHVARCELSISGVIYSIGYRATGHAFSGTCVDLVISSVCVTVSVCVSVTVRQQSTQS